MFLPKPDARLCRVAIISARTYHMILRKKSAEEILSSAIENVVRYPDYLAVACNSKTQYDRITIEHNDYDAVFQHVSSISIVKYIRLELIRNCGLISCLGRSPVARVPVNKNCTLSVPKCLLPYFQDESDDQDEIEKKAALLKISERNRRLKTVDEGGFRSAAPLKVMKSEKAPKMDKNDKVCKEVALNFIGSSLSLCPSCRAKLNGWIEGNDGEFVVKMCAECLSKIPNVRK